MEITSRDDLPLVLNVNHISKVLGVSKAVAYGIMKSEGFPCVTLGAKRLAAPRDRFLAWLDELVAE